MKTAAEYCQERMKTAAEYCKEREEADWNSFWCTLKEYLDTGSGQVTIREKYWNTFFQEERSHPVYSLITKYYDKLISLGFKIEKGVKVENCQLLKTRFLFFLCRAGTKAMLINTYTVSACCKEEKKV